MYCSSCGASLLPGPTVCPVCGASAPTASPQDLQALKNLRTAPILTRVPPPRIPAQGYTNSAILQVNGRSLPPPPGVSPLPFYSPADNLPGSIMALFLILVAFILGGSGLVYYLTVALPAQTQAQATLEANTTATAYANSPQGVYVLVTRREPIVDAPLDGKLQGYWGASTSSDGSGTCQFTGGAYHISETTANTFYFCSNDSVFDNFAMQVQMKIIRGDTGGITFRGDSGTGAFYRFAVASDKSYSLSIYTDHNSGKAVKILTKAFSSSIHGGINQVNLLTVIARGSSISLYVNKQFLVKILDHTYTIGDIGLFAEDVTQPADVAFNNVQIWNLS